MRDVDLNGLLKALADLEHDHGVQPVVFFDADHTIWGADLADAGVKHAIQARMMHADAGPAVARYVRDSGGEPTGEPHDDSRLIYERYMDDKVAEAAILEAQVVCFAGLQPSVVADLGEQLYETQFKGHVYQGIREIHDALRAAGVAIKVVSGTAQWLVEGAVRGLGIPAEDVFSARSHTDPDDGRITGDIIDPVTYQMGKVHAVERAIGSRRILAAFGDSISDINLLECASLRVAVNPRPGLIAHAEASDPDRWLKWVPECTVGGTPVYPLTTDRIVV